MAKVLSKPEFMAKVAAEKARKAKERRQLRIRGLIEASIAVSDHIEQWRRKRK